MAFPFRKVDGIFQHIHLLSRENFRQMFPQNRTLQKFRRVFLSIAIRLHKTEETPHPTQDTTLWTRMNTDVMQRRSEMLQVIQFHLIDVFPFLFQID